MLTKRCTYTVFRPLSTRALCARVLSGLNLRIYTPIGRDLTIIYPKRLPNSIFFLPIGDNPGSLGNVRNAVLLQTLCQRTSINCHAHSVRGVATYMGFRFTREAFRVRLQELESLFRRTLPRQRDIYPIYTTCTSIGKWPPLVGIYTHRKLLMAEVGGSYICGIHHVTIIRIYNIYTA